MPWTVGDVDRHHKGLTDEQKEQWVETANAVLQKCLADDGKRKECEGMAIRIANSKFEPSAQAAVACECLECGYIVTLEDEHCADIPCPECGGEMRRVERPGQGRVSSLQFTCNRTAAVQRKTVGGVEYLVAPVVAIRAGVLNGELVPAEEISTHFHAWDGRPLVVGHPQDGDGNDVSANAPAVLAERQAGYLFNTRFDDDALKGELWVDIARAKLVDGGPEVVARLEQNKPLEISTAYLRDRDEKPGKFNGVEYEAVARNLRPDHLAALLDAQGACSWEDGCGAPRVNKGDDMQVNVLGKARRPTYKGTTETAWSAPPLQDYLKAYPGDKPDTAQVEELPSAVKSWIAGHSLLGDAGADNFRDLSFFPVIGTDGKLNAGAVRAVLGGRGTQAKIPQGAKESAQAVARSLLDKEFKTEQAMNKNRVLGAWRTIASALGLSSEEVQMNKEEAVRALAADERLELSEEQLNDLSDDVLGAFSALLEETPAEEEKPAANEKPGETEKPAANEEPSPCGEPQEIPPAVLALAEGIEKRGGAAMWLALLDGMQADGDVQKAMLIEALSSNASCAFTKEQLAEMDAGTLETLHRSLSPMDYSGQGGGPMSNRDEIEKLEMPAIFGENGGG